MASLMWEEQQESIKHQQSAGAYKQDLKTQPKEITPKDMPETPLISMEILGHQLLCRWLSRHIL